MAENNNEQPEKAPSEENLDHETWQEKLGLSAKTPLGLFGISLTTICFTMTLLGLLGHVTGIIENPYAAIITFLAFPGGAVFGLILIPLSVYLRRKKWFKDNLTKSNIIIDLGKKTHQKSLLVTELSYRSR